MGRKIGSKGSRAGFGRGFSSKVSRANLIEYVPPYGELYS